MEEVMKKIDVEQKETNIEKENKFGIDFTKLYKNDSTILPIAPAEVQAEKRHRGRPKKVENAEIVTDISSRNLSMAESNVPYATTYEESQAQLKNTIIGIDVLAAQIEQDLQAVRNARTLKRKYDYVCELSSTIGSLVGNRISAIREINSTITQAHRLDMERAKQTKKFEIGQDDDKALMDMYRAYVNTPMGTIPNMPNISVDQTALNNPMNGVPIVTPNSISTPNSESDGYQKFLSTPSPEMTAIKMEQNPNIKVVVVYNQDTHDKFFDIQDVVTGQSIPGVDRPDPNLLEGIIPDIRNGIAKNIHAGLTYPLRLIGTRRFDEY